MYPGEINRRSDWLINEARKMQYHYKDIIMGVMASQITILTIV